jgi:hypothetical protein
MELAEHAYAIAPYELELGQETPPPERQTPMALKSHQTAEIEKWWPIVKAANIKAE